MNMNTLLDPVLRPVVRTAEEIAIRGWAASKILLLGVENQDTTPAREPDYIINDVELIDITDGKIKMHDVRQGPVTGDFSTEDMIIIGNDANNETVTEFAA